MATTALVVHFLSHHQRICLCLRFNLQETVQETRSQTTCGIYSLLLPQSSPSLVTTTNQLLLLSYLLVVVFLFLKLKALLQSFCPADKLRVVTSDAIIWPDKRLYIIIPFCHNTLQCTGRRRLVNHLTAIVVSGCQAVVKTCLLPLLAEPTKQNCRSELALYI